MDGTPAAHVPLEALDAQRMGGDHRVRAGRGAGGALGLDRIAGGVPHAGLAHRADSDTGQQRGRAYARADGSVARARGKNPGDVWIFPNVKSNHVEKTIHPCQFPVELVERLVLSLTNQRDIVFDPYMGVGTSVIAALMHNRLGYGCDVISEFVDIAWQRIHAFREGTLQTRPMNKPVYNPALPRGGHQ